MNESYIDRVLDMHPEQKFADCADVWVAANGNATPEGVPNGVLLTTRHQNGNTYYCVPMGVGPANSIAWKHGGHPNDVTRWRYPTPDEHATYLLHMHKVVELSVELSEWFHDFHQRVRAADDEADAAGYWAACLQVFVAHTTPAAGAYASGSCHLTQECAGLFARDLHNRTGGRNLGEMDGLLQRIRTALTSYH